MESSLFYCNEIILNPLSFFKKFTSTRKCLYSTNDSKWLFTFLYFQNKINCSDFLQTFVNEIDNYALRVKCFVFVEKLDGVGPVDNRPPTDKLRHKKIKIKIKNKT